ncbi:hypothetical protein ACOSP7_002219 [Xanthoceras sorbifolium]|uniref:DUF7787 domain-containing protein n=1 Tax=Xanthoceras sorbifolium TaxID=99658 RepID=A0ABQ8IKS4_9ROSI|nr:hypothetical protein JRO89_XS01G0196800 [Xanthoceras sorbifolium]
MKATKESLSMDEYLDFVVSPKEVDLTVPFLNQIISMHGFRKIHKMRKSVLSEAVRSLDLMDPSRSTLKENISPSASIAFDDIMVDLNDLSWQECCVTSIKTLSSCQDEDKLKINGFSSLQRSTDGSKVPRSRVCVAGDACGVDGELSVSTTSYSRVEIGGKTKKKRKRRVCKVG